MLFTDKMKLTNDTAESKAVISIPKEETEDNESNPSTNRPLFETPQKD